MINNIYTLYIFFLLFPNTPVKGTIELKIRVLVDELNLFEPIPFLLELKNNTKDELTFKLTGSNSLCVVQVSFDNGRSWADLYEDSFGNPNDISVLTLKENQQISRKSHCFITKVNESILMNNNSLKVLFRAKASLYGQNKEVLSKSISSTLNFGKVEKKIYFENNNEYILRFLALTYLRNKKIEETILNEFNNSSISTIIKLRKETSLKRKERINSQQERLKYIEELNLMLMQCPQSSVSIYLINEEIKAQELDLVIRYLRYLDMKGYEKISMEEIKLCKNILSKYNNDIKDLTPNQVELINSFLLEMK